SHRLVSPHLLTLSLHDALPIWPPSRESFDWSDDAGHNELPGLRQKSPPAWTRGQRHGRCWVCLASCFARRSSGIRQNRNSNRDRSEEHTSELQSRGQLVCRLLL